MVKLYCDRCGKEVERFNERRYKPIEDAANGEDTFFVVDVYSKYTYDHLRPVNYGDDCTRVVDKVGEEIRYDFDSPDLCIDCMREINNAVKTVWNGVPMHKKAGVTAPTPVNETNCKMVHMTVFNNK